MLDEIMDINYLFDSWFAPIFLLVMFILLYYLFYLPILLLKKPIGLAIDNRKRIVCILIIISAIFTPLWYLYEMFSVFVGIVNFLLITILIEYLYQKIKHLTSTWAFVIMSGLVFLIIIFLSFVL